MSNPTTNLGMTLPVDEFVAQKVTPYNAAFQILDALFPGGGSVSKRARVYNSAVQSLTNATVTALTFNSERWDTDTVHDTSSNTDRLTCKTAGFYEIIANVGFAANAIGFRALVIELNGALYIASCIQGTAGASTPTRLSVVTQYPLAINDYVRVLGYQESGGALNTEQAGNYSPEFMMVRLGA